MKASAAGNFYLNGRIYLAARFRADVKKPGTIRPLFDR